LYNDTIIPSIFDDLAVRTGVSKDTADGPCIKGKSVCGDQRDTFKIHSVGNIPDGNCLAIAAGFPGDSGIPFVNG
jgi:hypothetical protein